LGAFYKSALSEKAPPSADLEPSKPFPGSVEMIRVKWLAMMDNRVSVGGTEMMGCLACGKNLTKGL
jgi:hypothetical protein